MCIGIGKDVQCDPTLKAGCRSPGRYRGLLSSVAVTSFVSAFCQPLVARSDTEHDTAGFSVDHLFCQRARFLGTVVPVLRIIDQIVVGHCNANAVRWKK